MSTMKRMAATMPRFGPSHTGRSPRLRGGAGARLCLLGVLLLPAGPGRSEEIVVGAAASLREPLLASGRSFEAAHPGDRATFSFAASSWLAAQIRAGAPVDVFLSADERQVAALERGGWALDATRVVFAANTLALVVSPGAGLQVRAAADLAQSGLRRFALPAAAVPLGHYARAWLEAHGLSAALGSRLVQTADARATLAAVELGQADAALVYASDAALARRARIAYPIPAEEQPSIVYVGVLTPRGAAKPTGRAFLEFLLGPGRSELEKAGFRPPPEQP